MWKIFYLKNEDKFETMNLINTWKQFVYSKMNIKVKQYFAEKLVVFFDNRMIFQQKKGMHDNLIDSLANAENNMKGFDVIFKSINLYWIAEENGDNFLIVSNLPHEEDFYPSIKNGYGFELMQDDAIPMNGKIEKLKFMSWSTLVFDVSLSDFYKGWINYTPSLEKRSELQALYILCSVYYKDNNLSLTERIAYEDTIKQSDKYKELYNKILKIMPKIENSLEQEWRVNVVQNNTEKKNKVKQ